MEMERIFTFIEDLTKRLSRPLKDLDDIRFAMAALKEIRDDEIRIDMLIGPIEVSWHLKASSPNLPLTGTCTNLPKSNFKHVQYAL